MRKFLMGAALLGAVACGEAADKGAEDGATSNEMVETPAPEMTMPDSNTMKDSTDNMSSMKEEAAEGTEQ